MCLRHAARSLITARSPKHVKREHCSVSEMARHEYWEPGDEIKFHLVAELQEELRYTFP